MDLICKLFYHLVHTTDQDLVSSTSECFVVRLKRITVFAKTGQSLCYATHFSTSKMTVFYPYVYYVLNKYQ